MLVFVNCPWRIIDLLTFGQFPLTKKVLQPQQGTVLHLGAFIIQLVSPEEKLEFLYDLPRVFDSLVSSLSVQGSSGAGSSRSFLNSTPLSLMVSTPRIESSEM